MTRRSCEHCGSPFTVKWPSDTRRYCSRSCANKARASGQIDDRNSNWRGGKTKHELYEVYIEMVARCHRPSHPRYADYGGRGIAVCDEWRADFWQFVADVGPRPSGKSAKGRALWSLDRIDNDSGYRPGNVRWATNSQQARNSRPHWMRRHRTPDGRFA